jgi:hypothetical protein
MCVCDAQTFGHRSAPTKWGFTGRIAFNLGENENDLSHRTIGRSVRLVAPCHRRAVYAGNRLGALELCPAASRRAWFTRQLLRKRAKEGTMASGLVGVIRGTRRSSGKWRVNVVRDATVAATAGTCNFSCQPCLFGQIWA